MKEKELPEELLEPSIRELPKRRRDFILKLLRGFKARPEDFEGEDREECKK